MSRFDQILLSALRNAQERCLRHPQNLIKYWESFLLRDRTNPGMLPVRSRPGEQTMAGVHAEEHRHN
jgi:hypothetical protein